MLVHSSNRAPSRARRARSLGPALALWVAIGLAAGCGDDKADDAGAESDDTAADDGGADDGGSDDGGSDDGGSDDGGSDDGGDDGGAEGVDADEYVATYAQAMCAWAQECGVLQGFGGTYAACLELVAGQVEGSLSDCSYDPVAAQECLSSLESMGCDGGGPSPVCDAVCGDDE
jgi:hypothetical protein